MRSVIPPPYLTVSSFSLTPRRRVARVLRAVIAATAALLVGAAGAQAATEFYIRGGGDGHGIGMSQYGAYGYALHGADYQTILGHYYSGTTLGHTDPEQTVRVLLATGHAADFAGAATANPATGRGKHLNTGLTYEVTVKNGQLLVKTSAGKRVGTFSGPLTVSGPQPLLLAGRGPFRGSLVFSVSGSSVQTVNALGLDDYVQGVVAAEMPSSWATAALEAQAVAARTYAITTTVGGNGYDLYDDTRSQMYGGVNAETAATNAAVAATSGQIVTYDGRPVVTYFFASSGGYTESIQNVWPGSTPEPWLQGVPDPYDNAGGDPYHAWGSQMPLATAARKLGHLVKGSLLGIDVTQHGVSPRILSAQVVGTLGRTTVSGDQLQGIFGLATTLASFTTIATQTSGTEVSGSIYPAPQNASVSIQSKAGGSPWQTIATVPVSASGTYSSPLPGPGIYRVLDGTLDGPSVTANSLPVTGLSPKARALLSSL